MGYKKKKRGMTKVKSYILPFTALIIIVLYFTPLVFNKEKEQTILFPGIKVKEIELKKGEKKFYFQNKKNGWYMIKPIKWKAEENKINKLINKLKHTKLENPITDDKNKYKDYQVTNSGDYIKIKGLSKEIKVFIGKRGPRYSLIYVRIEGDNNIYLVDSSFANYISQKSDDFRDKTILKIDIEKIKKVRWKEEDKSFSMEKKEDGWYVGKNKLENEKVRTYLATISLITAIGFPEQNKLPEGAEEKGEIIITTDKDFILKLYKKGEKFYILQDNIAYIISKFKKEEIFKEIINSPPS